MAKPVCIGLQPLDGVMWVTLLWKNHRKGVSIEHHKYALDQPGCEKVVERLRKMLQGRSAVLSYGVPRQQLFKHALATPLPLANKARQAAIKCVVEKEWQCQHDEWLVEYLKTQNELVIYGVAKTQLMELSKICNQHNIQLKVCVPNELAMSVYTRHNTQRVLLLYRQGNVLYWYVAQGQRYFASGVLELDERENPLQQDQQLRERWSQVNRVCCVGEAVVLRDAEQAVEVMQWVKLGGKRVRIEPQFTISMSLAMRAYYAV